MHKQLELTLGEGRVRENVTLAPYTTMKIGGPADFFFQAESEEDITNAVKASHRMNLNLWIFGAASNVVAPDGGLPGLVVFNKYIEKKILQEEEDHVMLKVSSGYPVGLLAKQTAEAGWEGLEYHLGLPGTVGGAIYGNSKWTKPLSYIGDSLVSAVLVDRQGGVKGVDRDYFNFSYDYSTIQETGEIVVSTMFKLLKKDPKILLQRSQEALKYRKKTQPFGVPSSGCFFKNVEGQSVGWMIDELGLKGEKIGNAQVSDIHGNFILNTGGATAKEVRSLAEHMQDQLEKHHGVRFEREVIILDHESPE